MKIQNLALHNFGSFNKIEIRLEPSVSVVPADIAPTVFAAIARVLGVYIRSFYSTDNTSPTLSAKDGSVYPISLGMTLTDPDMQVELTVPDATSRARKTQMGPLVRKAQAESALMMRGQPVVLPVIAHYGKCTLTEKYDLFKGLMDSRGVGYNHALGPQTDFKKLSEWFSCATAVQKQRQNAAADPAVDAVFLLMRAVVGAVAEVTAGKWIGLNCDLRSSELLVRDARGTVEVVRDLPVCDRTSILIAADIAYRSVRLNEPLGFTAPQESPGIVLIEDNIVPLDALQKAFPKMQFIVSEVSLEGCD